MRRRLLLGALASTAMMGFPVRGRAETEFRIIVPELLTADAGTAMRILSPALEAALGHPVTIDFRPGAGGILGLTLGAHAAPDGTTLAVLTPALTLAPWLSRRMDCSPADFTPLGQISFTPAALVTRADSPWTSLAALLARPASAKPFSVAAAWDWQPAQIAQALFFQRTGLPHADLTGPRTDSERLASVLSQETDFAFVALPHAREGIASGSVKLLATTGTERTPEFPAAQTLLEAGLGISVGAWRILAAPAGSPEARMAPLAAALGETLAKPDIQAALVAAGVTPAWRTGPDAAPRIAAEYDEAGKLFNTLGLNVRGEPEQALR